MGNKLLEELRRDLVDGKLRIMHNGIDIYIDCLETGDKLIIPMTSAKGMQPDPGMARLERDQGHRGRAANPDDGQGPFKGFLMIVCEECGAAKAFCAKRETYSFRYRTNATAETITHTCLRCKAPVDMELNRRGSAYVTIGMKGGRAK